MQERERYYSFILSRTPHETPHERISILKVAESVLKHNEKHVVPTPLSGITVGKRTYILYIRLLYPIQTDTFMHTNVCTVRVSNTSCAID
jgi:hypothetical protein